MDKNKAPALTIGLNLYNSDGIIIGKVIDILYPDKNQDDDVHLIKILSGQGLRDFIQKQMVLTKVQK